MSKLLLSSALVAALCVPALAGNQDGNNQGQNGGSGHVYGAPGPIAGAGLPIIALGVGGLGIYWLISSRRRDL